jgi:hypothetical protein
MFLLTTIHGRPWAQMRGTGSLLRRVLDERMYLTVKRRLVRRGKASKNSVVSRAANGGSLLKRDGKEFCKLSDLGIGSETMEK